jgi:hypothetical protein
MPAKSEWLPRLPDITAALERVEAPVIDRSGVEKLFGVKRRRAIELMQQLGGFQAGGTFLVDRAGLLARLRAVMDGEEYVRESHRRERLSDVVERSRQDLVATRMRIPVSPEMITSTLDALPGVHLWPGILTVEFAKPVDLLEKLYGLARAIASDYEHFESVSNAGPAGE